MLPTLFPAVEAIGIVAFGLSGYLVAQRRCLDVYGTLVLSLVTALGGGTLRDVVLGRFPPANLVSPVAVLLAVGLPILLCLGPVNRFLDASRLDRRSVVAGALVGADAIGLAAFTVSGVTIAREVSGSATLAVFCGVLTATGGGMIRDLLAGVVPAVLRREIYAVASLAGAIGLVALSGAGVSVVPQIVIAMVITFAVRVGASLLRLHLPLPHGCQD